MTVKYNLTEILNIPLCLWNGWNNEIDGTMAISCNL